VRFEWDEAKRGSNLRKHGLDFRDVVRFDWAGAELRDDAPVDDEARTRALGFLDDRLIAIVYTLRGATCRIISMRRATRQEHRSYARE
jgi:uncharacterized DUF497 family protein